MSEPERPQVSWVRKLFAAGGLDRAIFVVGLCALTFLYGVATVHWKIFPYQLFDRAQLAWDAWRNLEPEWLPDSVLNWESQTAPTYPIRTLSPQAGREPLLMAGGYYTRMEDCPKFGCLAWVMDRNGKTLHAWPAPDPDTFFAEVKGVAGRAQPMNFYLIGVALAPDGGLVTTFHGRNTYPYQIGVAKFAKDGRVVWKRFDNSHHWPTIAPDGRIFVPYVKITHEKTFGRTKTPIACFSGSIFSEGVRIITPQGRIEKEFPIADALADAGYPGLVYGVRDGCDPYHVNGVTFLNAAAAGRIGAAEGDLLVSLREPSALVVLDRSTGALKHVVNGRSAGQHSPLVTPQGEALVFDNLGGDAAQGGTRVLKIDLADNAAVAVFPRAGEALAEPFWSERSGVLSQSHDGDRLLVAASKQGKVLEIDARSGKVLWTFDYVVDFAPYLKRLGEKVESTKVRTTANGAYYLDDLSFLASPSGTLSRGAQP